MTLVELYKQAVEALWGKRWPLARLELIAILKPIIAEARAQALEEAALWFAAPDTIKTWRAANVARKLRDMAECAREAGGK